MTVSFIRPVRVEGNVAYVTLTRGYEAIIDADQAEFIGQWNWYAEVGPRNTYAVRTDNTEKRKVRMHSVLLSVPEGFQVDHRNVNSLDNRLSNLRVASPAENRRNARRRVDSTSGYKGVSFFKETKKWAAYISIDKRWTRIGFFPTAWDAHLAYIEASRVFYGDFARHG